MKKEIKQLIDLSRKLGNDKKQTLAAGGNTSYKDNRFVWLKASGTRLGSMTEKSLVQCDRKKLEQLLEKKYSNNPDIDFEKAKADLLRSVIDPASRLQPSVEALLHVILPQPFVVHTHPTLVNALVCSRNADQTVQQLFGDRALLIPYRYPGLSLFLQVNVELKQYRKRYHRDPVFIFLKNHGVIVSGDTPEEIDARFEQIFTKIRPLVQNEMAIETLPGPDATTEILPAIRMMLSNKHLQILCVRRNALIDYFTAGRRQFEKVGQPFCFDHVKYNGAAYLFVDAEQNDPQSILKAFEKGLADFRDQNEGDSPRIILIKEWGLIATAQNARDAETRMALFEDQMQISFYAENFGGPVYLDREQ
ncbi:MAG: class II aldolase, partial [Bacteroidales bacterium]|nr:class II aldolase [Bacteroidales bacterium]